MSWRHFLQTVRESLKIQIWARTRISLWRLSRAYWSLLGIMHDLWELFKCSDFEGISYHHQQTNMYVPFPTVNYQTKFLWVRLLCKTKKIDKDFLFTKVLICSNNHKMKQCLQNSSAASIVIFRLWSFLTTRNTNLVIDLSKHSVRKLNNSLHIKDIYAERLVTKSVGVWTYSLKG